MNDGSYLDIIIFAVIAVILGVRLYSILGRRANDEPPHEMTQQAPTHPVNDDKVVALPRRSFERSSSTADHVQVLNQIRVLDPSFTPEAFLEGAVTAFGMVYEAFVKGDISALRPLLADPVFHSFSDAIRSRIEASEICENHLNVVERADIVEADVSETMVRLSVRFVSRQVIVLRDSSGRLIMGDPEHVIKVSDLWSLTRDIRSPDPNWLVIATQSQAE